MSDKVENLLSQMTLQEKVSMLAGSDMWHTTPIERLGIPTLKVTDGPNGARGGGSLSDGVKAACFPAGILLASTWNTELITRVGQALGQEAKTKGAHILLAPTVNIHRSPLGGRNFECFSEDPYLSARMAVAYITGVQSQGVGTSVKHYVCNDSEFERYSVSSEINERALREIYLPPFQAAVREAKAWTVMAAYNKINGLHATENPLLLTDILRTEWDYDGVAVSDWFLAVKSTTPSINAGLDLEMPGPTIWRGEKLLQAVQQGEVEEATLDESVRRLLHLLSKAGVFEHPEEAQEQAIDLPEQRSLIRVAATEGIVLLKNENAALPLQREQLKSIAVIGPNAKVARIMAGGSAQVNAHYAITPFDGIVASAGDHIAVNYELGCTNYKLLPLFDMDQLLAGTAGTGHGLTVEYFNTDDLTGTVVWTEVKQSSEIQWFGLPEGVDAQQFSVRCTARTIPNETGNYTFGLVSAGLSRLSIDRREIIDNWTQQKLGATYFGMGSSEVQTVIPLQAGQEYLIELEYKNRAQGGLSALRLGYHPPVVIDRIERAVAIAAVTDVAIVCAGLNGEWESEGADRADMELVGEQGKLIESVAAVNPRTIVVLNTGSPITMPWLDKVAAVVQAWYPGQECGNAIADILFGDANPSGKLSQTYPVRLEDNPAYINYPGENGKIHYGEGLFVGYRYYEKKRIEPLFPFGFGLSYTTFSYDTIQLSAQEIGPDETLQVSINVTNTGPCAGQEVVQLYIRDKVASLQRPEKELKAFAKVHLEAGGGQTVTMSIAQDALAYYDDLAHTWIAEAGEFEVLVGSSSQDMRAKATFVLTAASRFR